MCPTESDPGIQPPSDHNWIQQHIDRSSLPRVHLHSGSNGWSSPPSHLFLLRSPSYFSSRQKLPSDEYLLSPAGVDWLRSPFRLDNLLSRPDNRPRPPKSFLLAINLQIPARDPHSAVFYFASPHPIPPGSLLHRFVHGDDNFRNSRFKIVNRVVHGPWIVKAAVGNHAACLLGKALNCTYYRGENYLEIDVDIGSSAIASAVVRLAMGYVNSVTVDMGFVVEAQAEEELPERLIGAVRIARMEMSAAVYVETGKGRVGPAGGAEVEPPLRRGGPTRVVAQELEG